MKRNLEMNDSIETMQNNKVTLVERNSEPNGISLINAQLVAKKSPNDLVELAKEIQNADTIVHATTYNKLQVIVEQMRFLQQQAKKVLLEAKSNKDLHHVACNFVKIPGNIYHFYERPSGQVYVSILSPEEWGTCPHKHLGGYRLEHDQSWTPIDKIISKNNEIELIEKVLSSDFQSSFSNAIEDSPMEV